MTKHPTRSAIAAASVASGADESGATAIEYANDCRRASERFVAATVYGLGGQA